MVPIQTWAGNTLADLGKLERLRDLYDRGGLTSEEYDREKASIVRRGRITPFAIGAAVVLVCLLAIQAWFLFAGFDNRDREPPPRALALAGPVTGPPPEHRLRTILDPSMIGAEKTYLEDLAGPPKQIVSEENIDGIEIGTHIYQVDGCRVTAVFDGTKIAVLRVDLTKTCSGSFKTLYPNGPATDLQTMTLKDLVSYFGGGQVDADCLYSCGNGWGPEVWFEAGGSQADGALTIRAFLTLDNGAEIGTWADAMVAAKGEDWVVSGGYHCDQAFQPIAMKTLKSSRLSAVEISRFRPTRC